jgi:hypothetical protein
MTSYIEYEDREKITFTSTITGTSETNVFKCPYGMGVRFRLVKLIAYNTGGTATSVKVFDHLASGAPTDPPARGDTNAPLFQLGLPTADHDGLDFNQCPEEVFQQGMAVICSQGNVTISAVVIEA